MEITIQKAVLCAVVDDLTKVSGVPAFLASDEEASQKKAHSLARILEAVVHDLGDGVLILVKH